jgi:pimeloyl-ACP methyl ester carboxylesterase
LINFYVEELKTLVEKLGLDKFHICGHCLGGAIALCYAAENPGKIIKIVAESVGYFSDYKLLMKSDMTFKPYGQIDSRLKNDLIKMNGKDYAEKFWNYIYEYKKTYIMAEDYSILDRIKKMESPALVINGDRDFYFDVEHPVTAFRTFKNANLWIVPDTGHAPHITREDDFVKNVVRFLKK